MEPRIQYAKTSDGVNIAFAVQGEGRPLIGMTGYPFNHLRAELTVPTLRLFHEQLAARCRYIRFDARGTGLSDRRPTSISVQACALDIEAVVDRLGLAEFDVWAWGRSGSTAVVYGAQHSERLRRLVLWDSLPQTGSLTGRFRRLDTIVELMARDWHLFTETAAGAIFGWSGGEPARRFAAYMREAVTQQTAIRAFEVFAEQGGLPHLIPALSMPTLVLQFRYGVGTDPELAAELTTLLPNGTLAVLDGTWITSDELARAAATAILDFVAGDDDARAFAAPLPSGTAIILFADIADSTALTERLGDTAFRERARELDGSLRGIIRNASGTPIEGKLLGDGVLATFASARQAIEAALACGTAGDECGLPLHLGLHAGDVIREENNVFGGAVNIAARIAGESAAGEVLVSQTVRDLARTSAGVTFEERGERELKGVSEPVTVWAVRAS